MSTLKKIHDEFTGMVRGLKNENVITAKRANLYRQLILGNLDEVIRPCFPIMLEIIPEAMWQSLLSEFLEQWESRSPYFSDVAGEMVLFLQQKSFSLYPFLVDLAHYEWIELDVLLSEPPKEHHKISATNMLNTPLKLSPCARLLHYLYDVHNIDKTHQPQELNPVYLLVYKKEEQVKFLKINELSYSLLQLMFQDELSAHEVIEQLIQAYPSIDIDALTEHSQVFLQSIISKKIVV